ncbi:MAG: endolytic transglycosylase MltG [Proteobacteria bacterium]|nr:MAG: endolytic transglycosylase MltG [Pseudomonadota bacterium]
MSEAAQDARGRAPRWRRVVLALAGAVLLAAGAATAWVAWALAPADRSAGSTRLDVLHGDSLWKIARALERDGVVRDARAMVWLARWRGVDTGMRAGEYAVSASWGTARVLEHLVSGRVITYEVVLPEGLTAVEIAARLAEQGLVRPDEFVALVRDPASASRFGVEGPGLEGYLFPETYRMPHGLSAQQVAKILVDEFLERWRPLEAAAQQRGFGMRQTVTLASIVEKETGVASERPLVASVFWNRLRRGMRLESDPTTIYGIADFDGNLTRAHLEDASNPFNTYRIAGLPPSPIANPGEASLAAVVHPAESDYLFFVAQGDGAHVFARSFEEHNANVNRYQRRRSSR